MTRPLILTAFVLLALPAAHAAPVRDGDPEVTAAIAKGVDYLKGLQQPDGSWKDAWFAKDYRSGETALTLLALLKGGAQPGDPAISKGFDWLLAQPHKRVYCVSVAVLALEARYTPEAKKSIDDDQPLRSQIRKRFAKKAGARDRRWLASAVKFLSAHHDVGGYWRYPGFGDLDLSNTQFAVLALKAAQRMGAKVDPEIYLKTATGLLKYQEATGPQVMGFAVPAADRKIAGLLDKRDRRKKKKKKKRKRGKSETRTRDRVQETPSSTATRMHARGWGYRPGDGPRGSMTAAGLAVLVVCKSELEEHPVYQQGMGPEVDRALRDGAAWMANRFRVDRNPGAESDWLYYYLYTLERAGTLLALNQFADRDWYAEGREFILGTQKADGRFHCDTGGELDGSLCATSFAILFLKRSTVPIIKRPMTGGGKRYGGSVAASATRGGPQVTQRPDGQLDVAFLYRAGRPGQRVSVAGSFNGWSKDAHVLQDRGDGSYSLTVTVPAGRHTYKFVVDGDWRPDPTNPKGEPDGHGGKNSLIE